VLGALVNGVFLLALCFSIFMEAIERFFNVSEISNAKLVVIVGSLGLASNIIGLFLFHGKHAFEAVLLNSDGLLSQNTVTGTLMTMDIHMTRFPQLSNLKQIRDHHLLLMPVIDPYLLRLGLVPYTLDPTPSDRCTVILHKPELPLLNKLQSMVTGGKTDPSVWGLPLSVLETIHPTQ
jgi:hypothetical protein